ncbi:MAG: cellulase family glycosylhydrolase [Bacteroidetes bacterium]|nr:cellulase family glycosylhydrolase [Bacteroidota bacterium]MBU1373033.1 cellulase family glycosylhydrolase [Bacteroidota bacterium]MBU1485476.1 cellulase family glycosylhydrolase [Bacteroidota bacterium]MBU1761705.1 cellulase family glycosylhydrolase [Bacteroidota bacterium]MBU2268794.1 cellulase family glycosylhydrolase [Bacteroidota bacterium]
MNAQRAHAQGFLKADGTRIVDEKGQNFLIKGMGLGGWMLQEGYMFKLNKFGREYKIKEAINQLVGPDRTKEFYQLWLNNHTTKKDIDSLASWGFNTVRLPMHYRLYTLSVDEEPVKEKNTWLKEGFKLTDSLLSWCKAKHMYLILDLHATPGGQGNDLNISDRNPDKPSLWESEANQQKAVALWVKLAKRYKNEPNIAGYDIINEPNWGFLDSADFRGIKETKNEPLRNFMMIVTKAIRKVDRKHIIIIEGNGFGNNYRGIFPKWDDNMVMSFHKYGNFNNQGAIQYFLDEREKEQIPIWLGESGENSNTWFKEAIQLSEKNNIGWTWWQLKKIGINNPLEIKLTPSYQQLLDYWDGKAAKPQPDEAWDMLQSFALNTNIDSNIFHKDVIDAMFRQVKHPLQSRSFQQINIQKGTIIPAVNYDLGAQRIAYYDTDSASYQYTAGVHTVGNQGHIYRNDGVDIKKDRDEPYIFKMEDGEWLQYSVNASKDMEVEVIADLRILKNSILALTSSTNQQELAVNLNHEKDTWQWVSLGKFQFKKGENKLRVKVEKAGFDFKALKFD